MKFLQKVYRVYGWGLWIIALAIMFALFGGALLFTATLSHDVFETTYFHWTTLVQLAVSAFLFCAAFGAFFWIERRTAFFKRLQDDRFFRKVRIIAYIVMAVLLAFWLLTTRLTPVGDPLLVQWVASDIHQGDFSTFLDDGYIGKYPYQLGMVWYSYALGLIFGFNRFIAFQFVNIIAYIGIFHCLVAFGAYMGVGRTGQFFILMLAFLFYPFAFMVSFVYGNLMGLFLALLAIRFELRFFDDRKMRNAIASSLLIALSIFVKANYQVFLIGMVLTALLRFVKDRKPVLLVLIAFSLIGFSLQSSLAIGLGRAVSGEPLDEGVGSFAFIAMGLHDDETKGPHYFRAPGWYDDSTVTVYEECDYDAEALKERSIEDIKSSITSYVEDPHRAFVFAGKKFVSQWCNPDFQCIWNIEVMNSNVEQPLWSRAIMSERGQDVMRYYLKALQLGIELLVIVGLFAHRKDFLESNDKMILMLIVVGGVICHMIWEAKAQYNVTYYVLLFPYAVYGAQAFVRKLRPHLVRKPQRVAEKEMPL